MNQKHWVLWGTSLLLVLIVQTSSPAAIVNGYAAITGIAGETLTVGDVDETNDIFEVGEQIVLMQMQDDVIGTNTLDNSGFGTLGSIRSAGIYEVRTIASVTRSGGILTSITVAEALINTYYVGTNASVQAITFPQFGSPDYTTTTDISTSSWNGSLGGILAFQVEGVLTIEHNISANANGFRGATANLDGSSASCSGESNYRVATTNNFADKGEGIFRFSDPLHAAGQARILNGGGGGNSHNGGGGGGSNFSQGGQGGNGWPTCSPNAGGYGGIDLSTQISASRVFMGGGGGSGEGNNNRVQPGGNGGGIVLIKASEIQTNGTCGSRSISANGEAVANNSGNDGNSGGGGGGSIVFNVGIWTIAAGCPLVISANGGQGGDVGTSAFHGGGGGGGMGTVIFPTTEPTTNITIQNNPGAGGLNCATCTIAETGLGSNKDGVITLSSGPLPIELVLFEAKPIEGKEQVQLTWATTTETNNDHFTIERSLNTLHWNAVAEVPGAGNSASMINYGYVDHEPYPTLSYYRLKQTDFDGHFSYSGIRSVDMETMYGQAVTVYPNPTAGTINVRGASISISTLRVFTALGTDVSNSVSLKQISDGLIQVDMKRLAAGTYVIKTRGAISRVHKR